MYSFNCRKAKKLIPDKVQYRTSLAAFVGSIPLPNFTIRLQTSPGKDVGEPVNSLPPVKSPLEPWASGDTVPPTWTVEVASLADVNKIIDKKLEELSIRIAKLEAKLKGSEEDSGERADQAEHAKEKPHSDKASDEKSESTNDSDRKVEAKKSAEKKPEGRAAEKDSSARPDTKKDPEAQSAIKTKSDTPPKS
jgi:hypothetical protein